MRDDYQRFTDLGATVLAIAPEPMSNAERFLEGHPLPYPLLVDADHRVFDAYDVVSRFSSLGQRPAVFLIDAEGVVRLDHVGTQQWQIPTNETVLESLGALKRE